MVNNKIKVGDRVEVIGDDHETGHCIKIGSVAVVTIVNPGYEFIDIKGECRDELLGWLEQTVHINDLKLVE